MDFESFEVALFDFNIKVIILTVDLRVTVIVGSFLVEMLAVGVEDDAGGVVMEVEI